MSNKKITDLNSYSAAEISSSGGTDLFFVTDLAHQETKKITALEVARSVQATPGTYSGSFFGGLIGTASYAVSASVANNATSASYASVAGFAQSVANQLFGSGTVNYIPIWSTISSLGNSDVYKSSLTYTFDGNTSVLIKNGNLTVSGSTPAINIVSNGPTYDASLKITDAGASSIYIQNNSNGDNSIFTTTTGSLTFYTSGSNVQLTPLTGFYTFGTYEIFRTQRNDIYWFPYPGTETAARDAKFGIGVQPPLSYASPSNLRARLHINTWTSGSADYPSAVVTNNLPGIVVTAHGAADTDIFSVSSSGQVTATSYSGSNFNVVSFYGSASYAVSASQAATASYNPYAGVAAIRAYGFLTGSDAHTKNNSNSKLITSKNISSFNILSGLSPTGYSMIALDFTTAMPDTNYIIVGSGAEPGAGGGGSLGEPITGFIDPPLFISRSVNNCTMSIAGGDGTSNEVWSISFQVIG